MKTLIALLRGINVSGRNKIPMADLRDLAKQLGWEDPETYIQSGNLVFKSTGSPSELETNLEQGIVDRFGLSIPVIIRPAAEWEGYIRDNPFPEASETAAKFVQLSLTKSTPNPDAAEKIQERAVAGEIVQQVGDAIWIHYPAGVGQSKLTPALLDRLVGSSVTARNWRTVVKISEMLG